MQQTDAIKGKELELQVFEKLKNSKWNDIITGIYYRDLINLKAREFDMIARAVFPLGRYSVGQNIQVSLATEVKYFTKQLVVWKDAVESSIRKKYLERYDVDDSLAYQSIFNFGFVGKSWFQYTNSGNKTEGIYDALSSVLSVLSFDSIKYDIQFSSVWKHIFLPMVVYKSSEPVVFRGFDNKVLEEKQKTFVMQVNNLFPSKGGNYENKVEYVFVVEFSELEEFITKMTNDFNFVGMPGAFDSNMMSQLCWSRDRAEQNISSYQEPGDSIYD